MTEYFDRYKARCSEAESDRDLLATGYGDRIGKVIPADTARTLPNQSREPIVMK